MNNKKINVGFVMFEPRSGAFVWTLGENCLRTDALRRGMEFTTVSVRTVEEQATELFALLDKGMDAIILKPMARNHPGISAFIAKAHASGIPVISLDSPLEDEGLLCTVGSDNAKGQAMVAEYVFKHLEGRGKVAYFRGDERVPAGATRTRSFHETLTRYPGIEVAYENMLDWVAQISRREQGAQFMREVLQKAPDVVAVISTTDEGALGAMDVILERGLSKKILVAGFDGIPGTLMAIRERTMEVSVRQLPRLIATRLLDTLEAALRGEAVPKIVPVDVELVTEDGVDSSALDSLQMIPGLILHLASNHEEQRVLQQAVISTQQNILETVAAVSSAVSSIREPGEMMKQVVNLLTRRFSLHCASLYSIDPTTEASDGQPVIQLKANSSDGNGGHHACGPSRQTAECLRTGQHMVGHTEAGAGDGERSYAELVLPLKSSAHVTGILVLQSANPRAFNAEVVSVMQAIAQQIAVAMDNADLHRETVLSAQQQEQSREKLMIAEKMASLGRLTAGIAHEMNTPLAAVRAAVLELESLVTEYRDSIGDDSVNDDDHREIAAEMSKAISLASGAAERAAGFVRGVKSQTRDLSSQQLVNFNVVTTIQDAILLLSHTLREKNCKLELQKRADDLQVHGSPGRLAQVITNLITNAVDASAATIARDGGARIEISLEQEDRFVVMRVKDQGSGIPPEVLPRIFEPMFSTKKFGDGTGLGLTIVNDIVTGDFKGSIEIDSTVGQGTTFIVRLARPS
ncbi:substrate-binding domain-containing protein [Uliginosibacterium sp. H3]|uniref:histidine kinase n=1 Tax=Uliginosibacterium silvisoli TaxID=3114758 RepID=A0ABU6K5N3_9RHOO|nr:substrate-binding domain-containing protein [Uliginosibacterium sp. H3]